MPASIGYLSHVRHMYGERIENQLEKNMKDRDESEAIGCLAQILINMQEPSLSYGPQIIGDFAPACIPLGNPATCRSQKALEVDAAYKKVIEALDEYARALKS